jgi:hypothetical protein
MSRPTLEVADIFRDHGAAWRRANVGHVSLDQLKVMSAIERCRTAALGGHVARCEDCDHTVIAFGRGGDRDLPQPKFVLSRTLRCTGRNGCGSGATLQARFRYRR